MTSPVKSSVAIAGGAPTLSPGAELASWAAITVAPPVPQALSRSRRSYWPAAGAGPSGTPLKVVPAGVTFVESTHEAGAGVGTGKVPLGTRQRQYVEPATGTVPDAVSGSPVVAEEGEIDTAGVTGVGVPVPNGVLTGVSVGVLVGVLVSVGVAVPVGVLVAVPVAVAVGVEVAVEFGVSVGVGVEVAACATTATGRVHDGRSGAPANGRGVGTGAGRSVPARVAFVAPAARIAPMSRARMNPPSEMNMNQSAAAPPGPRAAPRRECVRFGSVGLPPAACSDFILSPGHLFKS